jgi:hypothetical protein
MTLEGGERDFRREAINDSDPQEGQTPSCLCWKISHDFNK